MIQELLEDADDSGRRWKYCIMLGMLSTEIGQVYNIRTLEECQVYQRSEWDDAYIVQLHACKQMLNDPEVREYG